MFRKTITTLSVLLASVLVLSVFAAAEEKTGMAPVAENLEFTTFRGVSVAGQLKAEDPDGGTLTYKLETTPVKGTVDVKSDGSFVYTPKEGKRGCDYFGYKAYDSDGNASSEATVVIRLKKQSTAVTYSDMQGNGAQYAATVLAEKGVFTGENLSGEYLFEPEKTVTRGEFLTMCMKLTGSDVLTGVVTTGFSDDESIPDYQKPYVSTALLTGIISGYSKGLKTAVFEPNTGITYAQAAVILDRTLKLTDVNSDSYNSDVPSWAVQSCANVAACNICTDSYEAPSGLTRADCAQMLLGAMNVLDNR